MEFHMTKELDKVFDHCKVDTLDEKTTALVTFGAQLAAGNDTVAKKTFSQASKAGVSVAELSMAACLAACNCGPRVTRDFATIMGKPGDRADANLYGVCSDKTLDQKTFHLVSLAVCLATNCMCASGHIVRLKELKASEASIHRAACIAAEECGLTAKYSYVQHLENVRNCTVGCVC